MIGDALLTTLTGLLATTTLAATTPLTPLDWTETPTVPGHAVLYTTDAAFGEQWAVGIELEQDGKADRFHPLAIRRDGSTWSKTPAAAPDGRLDDVMVRGRNDVWAVGATNDGRSVLQHWNGRAWSLADVPESGTVSTGFTAVDGTPGTLLVGRASTNADGDYSTAVLWHAAGRWQQLPEAGLQHISYIDDLEPVRGKEILAAGVGGLARYDGTVWHKVELPITIPEGRQYEIAQLVVRSGNDIWAVGEKGSDEFWRQPLALHFDGKEWTELPTPARTGQFHDLEFVDGRPVAVGGDPTTGEPLIAEFDGQVFVQTTTPPGAGYLHGSTTTGSRVWTVGVALQPGLELPYAAVGKAR
jgi:hypothetical protein